MSDEPYVGRGADGTITVHHRTVPERLRYLAGKLREPHVDPASVAMVLELTADEIEGPPVGAIPVRKVPGGQLLP